jgi:hypothetical protein
LGNIALKDDLISVIEQALDASVDAETFADMVAERVRTRQVETPADMAGESSPLRRYVHDRGLECGYPKWSQNVIRGVRWSPD